MPRLNYVYLILICCFIASSQAAEDDKQQKRKGKLFPVFQVITFANDPCVGSGSKNGTCFTASECSAKGGVSSGSCASSYGVCCVFTLSCGQTSSQNCTYFEVTGAVNTGACRLDICKCNSNICQLRLDFNSFVISGPSTDIATVGKTINGALATVGTKAVTAATQCRTDTFSVTNPNGAAPPVICGTNTGEHMYVDASDQCNNLAFQLGTVGIGTTLAARSWSIKITQYACDYNNLAPPGCTQYFFGATSQVVKTFNFDGGEHLANQDQNICVRRERNLCRICWTQATALTDFSTSTNNVLADAELQSKCCQYGAAGAEILGYDCATIPGALRTTLLRAGVDRFCGSTKGLLALTAIGTIGVAKSVCSDTVPFNVRFLSDNYEFSTAEAAAKNKGFKLLYTQLAGKC